MRRRDGIRSSSLSGGVGFLAALAFYVVTLLPGVAFWDTGEMQTVPYLLGIAHPTGFPLFVLGGWAFAHLMPLGDPAWRLSLFSAVAAAGAAGMLAAFVTELAGDAFAGVAASVVYALGDVAWTRGVRAEVHDLALFFTALALTAAERAGRERSPRAAGVAALACGLGVATHPIALLAVPAVVATAWPALATIGVRACGACAALAILPLAAYAYVPLRSAYVERHGLDPATTLGVTGGAIWDDAAPSTPAAFGRYVTGSAFDPAASLRAIGSARGAEQAWSLATAVAYREYSLLILALALTGMTFLAIRRPRVVAGLVSIAVFDVAFAANYGPESDAARYLLGGLWGLGACAGVGAWWLASAVVGDGRVAPASLLASALLVGGLWPKVPEMPRDLAHQRGFEDARPFVANVERLTAPKSLVVASWTFATPLAYEAYVTRAFGPRLLCGWPLDYAVRFGGWRARFAHVYFIVPPRYDLGPFGRRIFANARYQIAELRP